MKTERKKTKNNITKKKYRTADKKYKQLNCSPNPEGNNFSCYSNNSLFKIKKYWNARHPRDKITTNDTKKIWQELSDCCTSRRAANSP